MLNLLYLFGYLVIGIIAIYGAAFIHIVKGEMQGYRVIDYWSDHSVYSMIFDDEYFVVKFVFGLFIWPVRLVQFCIQIPDLYVAYEYEPENKTELF